MWGRQFFAEQLLYMLQWPDPKPTDLMRGSAESPALHHHGRVKDLVPMAHLRGVVVEREIYYGPQVVLDIESDADTHRVKHAVAVHRNRVNLPEARAVSET